MKPDTSRWRDSHSYDFFDALPTEGLAWECLRRSEAYQQHYEALAGAGTETAPCRPEAELLWGLRFPGDTRPVRPGAGSSMVALRRPGRFDPDAGAGFPVIHGVRAAHWPRRAS